MKLLWVARTSNTKTGDVPTAYVGTTVAECLASCEGCSLLDGTCYAWAGLNRVQFTRMVETYRVDPERYSLKTALRDRKPTATIARIGAMGDPARADREELRHAVKRCTEEGLAVISYTHHWREDQNQDLRRICMASCEDEAGAQVALRMGWVPAVLLPWDHQGKRFRFGASQGVVCPAQTKPTVTCDDCRMCAIDHPVWEAGRVRAIGFLDHSRAARREVTRSQGRRQLPLFGSECTDIRPS